VIPVQKGGRQYERAVGISIIVVNFNYECSLLAAIDSALSQNHLFCGFANRRTTPRPIVARYGDGSDP
jgi:hypothetical protein